MTSEARPHPTVNMRLAKTTYKAATLAFALLLYPRMSFAQPSRVSGQTEDEAPSDLSLVELLGTEVVSASLGEQSLAEAAAVIDVVTQEEIRARGYRTVGEALQSIAGIDVTSDHYQDSVGVRGVGSGVRGWSRIIKVMIDNQPVSFRSSGENFLGVALLPIGVIERIEVIRGPASVLYGANAFLGVVNIITRRGYGLGGNSLTAGYEGGRNIASPYGQAIVAQQFNDVSVLLGAAEETRSLDGYRLEPLPGRTHVRADEVSQTQATPSASAFGRISYDSARFGTLSLDAHFQRLNRSAEFSDWGVMTHDNQMELMNGFARLSYHLDLLRDSLSLGFSVARSEGGVGPSDRLSIAPQRRSYIKRDVGYRGNDISGTATYRIDGKSSATVGFDGTSDEQTLLAHYTVTDTGERILNPPANSLTGTRNFQNLGAFAHTTLYPFGLAGYRPLTNLGLAAGARYDSHSVYGDNWNARAGLVYSIEDRHFAKLLFGTSYRAPSPTQLYSNYIVPGGVIGNPGLQPERARTLEVALGTSPVPNLTLRVDGYYTLISDRVEIRKPPPSGTGANALPMNSTPITSRGFEAQVDYKTTFLNAFLNYSFQNSTYPKADYLSLEARTVPVRTDAYPAHLIKGGLTFTKRAWFLRTHLEGRYIGKRLGDLDNNSLLDPLNYLTNRYAIPAYALFDLALSTVGIEFWRGHETMLLGKVSNLFDTRYTLPGYSGFDIPGFSRSFYFSVHQDL